MVRRQTLTSSRTIILKRFRPVFPPAGRLLSSAIRVGLLSSVLITYSIDYEEQTLNLTRELVHYDPDIFIIITGHNEFSAIRYHRDLLSQGPFVRFMRVFLDNFRLVHLLKHFLGVIKPAKIHYEYTPPHGPITPGERAYILSQMRKNLTETARVISQANAKLILRPAAMNLKHPPSGLRNKASLYYLEAEMLLSERRYEEAYQAYWKTLKHDFSPVRMFPAQIDVIHDIAGKVGATYINMQTLFNKTQTTSTKSEPILPKRNPW